MNIVQLPELKSLEPLDPAMFLEVLEARHRGIMAAGACDPGHTVIERGADGRATIHKRSFSSAVKSILAPDAAKKRAESLGFAWYPEAESSMVTFYASDERVDWHGDIVMQEWDFSAYEDNPVLLDSHQWGAPPIGGSLDWKVVERTDDKYKGPALAISVLFTQEGVYDWADTIKRLVLSGFLKTCSVGFFPGEVLDVKDQEERKKLGIGQWGMVFSKNSLVELSPTSVPANCGSHAVSNPTKARGILEPADIVALRELRRRETKDRDSWGSWDRRTRAIWSVLFPDVKLESHDDPEVPFDILKEIDVANHFDRSNKPNMTPLDAVHGDDLKQHAQNHMDLVKKHDAMDARLKCVEEDIGDVMGWVQKCDENFNKGAKSYPRQTKEEGGQSQEPIESLQQLADQHKKLSDKFDELHGRLKSAEDNVINLQNWVSQQSHTDENREPQGAGKSLDDALRVIRSLREPTDDERAEAIATVFG
jgi:hypothetical protein